MDLEVPITREKLLLLLFHFYSLMSSVLQGVKLISLQMTGVVLTTRWCCTYRFTIHTHWTLREKETEKDSNEFLWLCTCTFDLNFLLRLFLPNSDLHLSKMAIWIRPGGDLVLYIGCFLDGGRSKCKPAVDCKKGARFKQIQCLEMSGIHHQREVCHCTYDVFIKNDEVKKKKVTCMD